jgi:transposase InsO family protein
VIEQVHKENFGVYGARKVHAQLRRQGHAVARCTVERLMRTAGLRGLTRARGPRTTVPGTGPDTQGVGKVRYVRPDLRRWQAEARIGSLGRPCGSLPAR